MDADAEHQEMSLGVGVGGGAPTPTDLLLYGEPIYVVFENRTLLEPTILILYSQLYSHHGD